MTKQECAIIMAHTGICMLTGEEFNEFHKYVEYIMGRPVWTHELAEYVTKMERKLDEIKQATIGVSAKNAEDTFYLIAEILDE